MSTLNYAESELLEEHASFTEELPAGVGWMKEIKKGQTMRILDLEGNQAVDTIFYNADNFDERYSTTETIKKQRGIYLTTGTALLSNEGNTMFDIVADTCGRHDTLGGACSAESNTVRYALEKKFMHNCRDNYLLTLSNQDEEMTIRDITSNINFFMNVPVTSDGHLKFDDGVSGAGRYVELKAKMNMKVLISNCPQLNNPCNAYNPTPVKIIIWDE